MKRFRFLIMAVVCALLFAGAASAAVLPNATVSTSEIDVATAVYCDGTVSENTGYSIEHTNQFLDGPPLSGGEMYGTAVYNSHYTGMNGITLMEKTSKFNDESQPVGGNNIRVRNQIEFDANEGGIATGHESIEQFNAGQAGVVLGVEMPCPLTTADDTDVPPFNEYAGMGSYFIAHNIDLTTSTGATTTADTIYVPSRIAYSITADGRGDIGAYMNVFSQTSRGDGTFEISPGVPSLPTPSSVTTYHDSTSASGNFNFYKKMGWTSGNK